MTLYFALCNGDGMTLYGAMVTIIVYLNETKTNQCGN